MKPTILLNDKRVAHAAVDGAGFTFKGTATNGQGGPRKVRVSLAGYAAHNTRVAADGTWKVRFVNVPPGDYQARVTAVDNAGNQSTAVTLRLVVR